MQNWIRTPVVCEPKKFSKLHKSKRQGESSADT